MTSLKVAVNCSLAFVFLRSGCGDSGIGGRCLEAGSVNRLRHVTTEDASSEHSKCFSFLSVWTGMISQCVSAFLGSASTGTSQWTFDFCLLFFWCSWVTSGINTIFRRSAVGNAKSYYNIWLIQTLRKAPRSKCSGGRSWNSGPERPGNAEKDTPCSSTNLLRASKGHATT